MRPLLSVRDIVRVYEIRRTVFSFKKEPIRAVDHVSFELEKGHTMGVVGESGSGKSTLARCIARLEEPDSGTVFFQGKDWVNLHGRELKAERKEMQIIFQDPYSSLNPRKKVIDIIAEPLVAHDLAPKDGLRDAVVEILKNVGLDEDFLTKYPHEMSGGQRQRVAIGRALSTSPAFIIADEPVSALDVSVQAQIINLFLDIRERSDISMLFISHDLNIVRFVSDSIMVMYRGKVVEMAEADDLFECPLHPYTRMLVETVREGALSRDEIGGPPSACVFYDRCPDRQPVCQGAAPVLSGTNGHLVACHLAG